MRSAEPKRVSSCALADRIASLAVECFRQHCPSDIEYKQTVLAAFLIQTSDSNIFVAAFGVGTKVVSKEAVCNALKCSAGTPTDIVKDCHAEILAKRGLLKFLRNEMIMCLRTYQMPESINGSCILNINNTGTFSIYPDIKIHFYTSSQPCGNATIKKWAKCSQIKPFCCDANKIPIELLNHARYFVTARSQGEVALLVKKGANVTSLLTGSTIQENIPNGTASVSSGLGCCMTCSDKIAKWNALGVQGVLLSCVLDQPLYIASITVGRKFSQRHCERALCCRIQDFSYEGRMLLPPAELMEQDSNNSHMHPNEDDSKHKTRICTIQYSTHHPAMMCTSVKLDEGVILTAVHPTADDAADADAGGAAEATSTSLSTGNNSDSPSSIDNCISNTKHMESRPATAQQPSIGAVFDEKRCLCWWSDRNIESTAQDATSLEIIDGSTGYRYDLDGAPMVPSSISSLNLLRDQLALSDSLRHFRQIDSTADETPAIDSFIYTKSDYVRAMQSVRGQLYQQAKDRLLTDPKLFQGWIQK